jgi:dTDP-glucose 4,6-dehydratase
LDTILVTGGAGFLGSWFVRQWLAAGRGRVVVLDKLTYAGSTASLSAFRKNERLAFHRGDIADGSLVARLLVQYRPQAVINFAAESHVDRSIDAADPFVTTNVVGTWQLLEESLAYWRQLDESKQPAFRFLQVSTDEVYGPIESPGRASESSPLRPSSPYAASKAAADQFVRAYHHTYGLPTLIVHPSNNYGPFQFPEKLVPLVILNAMEGWPIPIYGDGSQRRNWLFGEDLCRAVSVVLEQGTPGEAYNVASSIERTNVELVRAICGLVDRLVPELPLVPTAKLIEHVADRPGHDARYALDITKIRGLGWEAQVDLAAGLEQTVQWYAANRAWVAEVTAGFDRSRRLGLA